MGEIGRWGDGVEVREGGREGRMAGWRREGGGEEGRGWR
jgi:hypothetical protein